MTDLTPADLPGRMSRRVLVTESGCWLYTGATQTQGYASVALCDGTGRTALGHRYAYEALVGPIPDGAVIDHRCHNGTGCNDGRACIHRRCVNPSHLEPVPQVVNSRRSENTSAGTSTCKNGHPFDSLDAHGHRRCSRCYRAYLDSHRAEHAAKQRAKYAAENPHSPTPSQGRLHSHRRI